MATKSTNEFQRVLLSACCSSTSQLLVSFGPASPTHHPPLVPSLACFSFSLFSCFINSLIPTGTPLNKSSLVKSVSSPVPQLVSDPPPSSNPYHSLRASSSSPSLSPSLNSSPFSAPH